MTTLDKKTFFDRVRRAPFGGRLTRPQVEGMARILDYRDTHWPAMIDEELAYVLATVYHETAHTMQPVTERGGAAYLRSKAYYPWHGRGLVQITWKRNYAKWGITNPEDALQWPVSLHILFEGMVKGMFTGRKLAHYIDAERQDFAGARRIINGTDRAAMVAGYAEAFLDALEHARAGAAAPAPPPVYDIDPEPEELPVNLRFLVPILRAVLGNPLTGIPGAIGVIALIGPVLSALGAALTQIAATGDFWSPLLDLIRNPEVAAFAASFGLVAAKDNNVSGGSRKFTDAA